MSGGRNLVEVVADELRLLMEPILVAGDAAGLERLLAQLGWRLDALTGRDVATTIRTAETVVEAIEAAAAKPLEDLDDVLASAAQLGDALAAVDNIRRALTEVGAPDLTADLTARLSEDLSQHLLVSYLRRRSPALFEVALVLTLIVKEQAEPLRSAGRLVRYPVVRPALRLDNLPTLLRDPLKHLEAAYVPESGIVSESAAEQVAENLFRPLRSLLVMLGADAAVGLEGALPADRAAPALAPLRRSLTVGFGGRAESGQAAARGLIGATCVIVPSSLQGARDLMGPGLEITPFGTTDLERTIGGGRLTLSVKGESAALFIGTRGSAVLEAAGAAFGVRAEFVSAADGGSALVIGGTGTRLEIGSIAFALEAGVQGQQGSLGIEAWASEAVLAVAASDGDGFLQRILPPDGLRAEFDLGLGWANGRGVYVRGGAGLEATLPLDVVLLDLIKLEKLAVRLAVGGNTESVALELGATGGLRLGPIHAAVEDVGVRLELGFPRTGGNLGFADLRELRFKPPNGVALLIDQAAVTGGGYLFLSPEKGEYAGVVQLEFAGLSLSAVGLITTRPGEFSLLVIISVEFSPVQLGFGFTLNGVGGLVAINRAVALDEIQAGLKEGALDTIMFPPDPVRNAPQLVTSLNRYLPAVEGQYVVGPAAVIAWGSPPLVTITLAILIEFPSPLRLILAGRLRMVLPDEKAAVAVLRMDLLGSIDFTKGRLAIDATLRDSRVAAFALAGDVAIRASWREEPGFLFSAGGFHPRFKPPGEMRRLDRLSISLAKGDNPRLRLEAYVAVTSNTVQFGARLDLYASVDIVLGRFSVAATIGFDALFQLKPRFSFVVDIYASIVLKWNDNPFLGIELAFSLSGPEPWRATGEATFRFLGTHTVRFELTVGKEPAPEPPELIDVLGLLLREVEKPTSWEAQAPEGGRALATVRALAAKDEVVIHPLGSVTVRQRVVPLEREITRFGNGRPQDATYFELTAEQDDGTKRRPDALLDDYFARAQFWDLDDAARLAAPSFALMPAGARFGAGGLKLPDQGIREAGTLVYEEHLVDVADNTPDPPPRPESPQHYVPAESELLRLVEGAAAARNGATSRGVEAFVGERLGIEVRPLQFVLARPDDMRPLPATPPEGLSFAQASELLNATLARTPKRPPTIEIVARHEVLR